MAVRTLTLQTSLASSGGNDPITSDGWMLGDEAATSGDLLYISPTSSSFTDPSGPLHSFEAEITDGGGTRTEVLPKAHYTDMRRRIRVNGEATVRIRGRFSTGTEFDSTGTPDTNGSWTPTKTLSPSTGTLGLAIEVANDNTSGFAPFGAVMKAVLTGSSKRFPEQEADFKWTFGDPGNFTRLGSDMPWGVSRDIAYGPGVGHCWPSAGNYSVICECNVDGETVYASVDIDVDSDYSALTIVDIGSDPSDDYTTVEAAHSGVSARYNAVYFRLRGGETHTMAGNVIFEREVFIGAIPGTGTPTVTMSSNTQPFTFPTGNNGRIVLDGINFEYPYDPSDIGDMSGDAPPDFCGVFARTSGVTIHDCLFKGWNWTIDYRAGSTDNYNTVISNTVVQDYYNFAFYFEDVQDAAFEGVSVLQNPATFQDVEKNVSPRSPDHGPFRSAAASRAGVLSFQNCDFTSYSGWSGDTNSGFDEETGFPQGVIRFDSSAKRTDGPTLLNIDRFRAEGSVISIGNSAATTDAHGRYHDILLDKVHLASARQLRSMVGLNHVGVWARNIVYDRPNVPVEGYLSTCVFAPGDYIIFGTSGEDPLNDLGPINIYNVTALDQRTLANQKRWDGTSVDFELFRGDMPSEVQLANTVLHAPETDNLNYTVADAPLDLSNHWQYRHEGRRHTLETYIDFTGGTGTKPPLGATVTGATSGASGTLNFAALVSGSFAGDDATGTLAITSITGGPFQNGEALQVSGTTFATASSAPYTTPMTAIGIADKFAKLPAPQTGSAAIGDATGDLIAYRDFYGDVRGASPSRGALEPEA